MTQKLHRKSANWKFLLVLLFYLEVKDFGDLIGEGKSEIRRKVKIEAVALIYKERFRLPFE